MFCIECGTKLEANQKFCKNCGSPINITEEKNEPLTTSNQKKESNAAKKNSGKKNDRLYALGFWFVNWLLITSKGYVNPTPNKLLTVPIGKFNNLLLSLLYLSFNQL